MSPEISVNIEIWCSCGNGLCNQSTAYRKGFQVEPCERCLTKAREEGYQEGYEAAEKEAAKKEAADER